MQRAPRVKRVTRGLVVLTVALVFSCSVSQSPVPSPTRSNLPQLPFPGPTPSPGPSPTGTALPSPSPTATALPSASPTATAAPFLVPSPSPIASALSSASVTAAPIVLPFRSGPADGNHVLAAGQPNAPMSEAMANEIAALARARGGEHVVHVTWQGQIEETASGVRGGCTPLGGSGSSGVRSGRTDDGNSSRLEDALHGLEDATALATTARHADVVRAVAALFGVGDGDRNLRAPGDDSKATGLADGLLAWQRDFERAIQSITGQTMPVPLLVASVGVCRDVHQGPVSDWHHVAHVRSKGRIVVVTPGYQLPYGDDCTSLTIDGQRRLGEYFAKAYARIAFDDLPFEPVRPKDVTIAGNVVTATYYVPKPPLVLDTARVADPGSFGFEYADETGAAAPKIASVVITAPDTVTITLSAGPVGIDRHLRYALAAPDPTCSGPTSGVRGNLRDSDDTPSQYGYELFNWGVSYDVPVR